MERRVILCRATDQGTFYRVGLFMIVLGTEYLALDLEQAFKSCSHLLGEDDFSSAG